MKQKLKIKKGDIVKVTAGSSKGKEGKVLEVIAASNRVLVEGVNTMSKHTKPSAAHPDGGIVEKEAPIHISNLVVLDAKGTPSRIGRKLDSDGNLVRYFKKTGEEIK